MHKKYTPSGNFSPKRGNKNFYKGKGGNKYGKSDKHGARAHARLSAPLCPATATCYLGCALPLWSQATSSFGHRASRIGASLT